MSQEDGKPHVVRGSQGRKRESYRKKIIKVLTIGTGGDNQSHVSMPRRSRSSSFASMDDGLHSGRNPSIVRPELLKKVSTATVVGRTERDEVQPLPRPGPPQL